MRERPDHRDEQRGRDRHEGHESEEHPPPTRVLGERSGDDRSDERRHDPRRRQRGEHLGLQRLDVRRPDHHVQRGDDQPAPQPLHDAADDQLHHLRRGPRSQQAAQEGHHSGDQRQPRTHGVAGLAGRDHPDHVGDQEPGERPAVRADAVQVASRGRQRRRHRHRLERRQRDDQQDAERRDAQGRREDRGRGRAGRRIGASGDGHPDSMQVRQGSKSNAKPGHRRSDGRGVGRRQAPDSSTW